MNPRAMARALDQGAPISCATCRHFYEGNSHCKQQECGGPTLGRDFPSYDGPIPRDKFVERCLVCGHGNPGFRIVGLATKFSLCRKHRKVYDHIGTPSPDQLKHPVTVIAVSS